MSNTPRKSQRNPPRKRPSQQRNQQSPAAPITNRPRQNRYLLLFLMNVIVTFLWQMIFPLFGLADYGIGFGLGLLGIWLYDRAYGRRAYHLVYFIVYVLWAIVLSNFSLAKIVLQPRSKLDPGIIAVPLTVSSGLEIMILASVITLTPGTISVDLEETAEQGQVLYVHNLTVGDPEEFRQSVKSTFERLLLRVTQGGDV